MKTRPIFFNSEMVSAILAGRKTQTRQLMEPQPVLGKVWKDWIISSEKMDLPRQYCPYGIPGDRLWVRETWFPIQDPAVYACAGVDIIYKADWDADGISREEARDAGVDRWRSPIFMPRRASRITLEIINVHAERLQDIKAGDVAKEGWPNAPETEYVWTPGIFRIREGFNWFRELWDSINTKRGYGWDVNPWGWVIEFVLLNE